MLTRSFPFRPIISPCVTYFRRFSRIFPRTICLNRDASRSIFMTIFVGQASRLPCCRASRRATLVPGRRDARPTLLFLHIPTRKNTGDIVQNIGGSLIVVTKGTNQPALHDVDLSLPVLID